MNSCFHGDAVTQRQYYLNPVMQILDAENGHRPTLTIEGRSMNTVDEKARKWCLTERDRFEKPYTMKPMKKPPKTIFRPQIAMMQNGQLVSIPVAPPVSKDKKRRVRTSK